MFGAVGGMASAAAAFVPQIAASGYTEPDVGGPLVAVRLLSEGENRSPSCAQGSS